LPTRAEIIAAGMEHLINGTYPDAWDKRVDDFLAGTER
jgi:hypothetical protein